MRQRLSHILLDGDCGPVLFILSSQILLAGLWFLSPIWETFGSVATYRTMAMIASESYWGVLFVVLGLGLFWVTLGKPSYRTQRIIALTVAFVWYIVAGSAIYSNVATLAAVMFGMNALAASWCYTRLHINGGC